MILKILITGDKGFIGTYLSESLSLKHIIIGVDRLSEKEVISIRKSDLKDIDCVIHLAGQTSV